MKQKHPLYDVVKQTVEIVLAQKPDETFSPDAANWVAWYLGHMDYSVEDFEGIEDAYDTLNQIYGYYYFALFSLGEGKAELKEEEDE